jgi:hypothetical protein
MIVNEVTSIISRCIPCTTSKAPNQEFLIQFHEESSQIPSSRSFEILHAMRRVVHAASSCMNPD